MKRSAKHGISCELASDPRFILESLPQATFHPEAMTGVHVNLQTDEQQIVLMQSNNESYSKNKIAVLRYASRTN